MVLRCNRLQLLELFFFSTSCVWTSWLRPMILCYLLCDTGFYPIPKLVPVASPPISYSTSLTAANLASLDPLLLPTFISVSLDSIFIAVENFKLSNCFLGKDKLRCTIGQVQESTNGIATRVYMYRVINYIGTSVLCMED